MDPLSPRELDQRILQAQDGLLVLDKPSDLPSSGCNLQDPDCLQFQLMQRAGGMVWALHQLDADTTGLNLFVTQKSLVQPGKLRMAWPNCTKSYLAVMYGNPEWEAQQLDAPIGSIPLSSPPSLGVHASGRAACSHFRVLDRGPEHCLVLVQIQSGRTHQIRIHAAHLGHPLVGEEWYRKPACKLHCRQALHAWRMEFLDAQEPSVLEAPPPPDFLHLCQRLELSTQAWT